MSKIKTFRGLINDNTQETINLHTIDGKTGYKIVNFSLMAIDPIGNNQESVVKIFSVAQTATTSLIDFSDSTLLAAGYLENDNSGSTPTFNDAAIVFGDTVFNQDIYLTHVEQGADAVNYYLELEQVSLDSNETAVATLKNIKNR